MSNQSGFQLYSQSMNGLVSINNADTIQVYELDANVIQTDSLTVQNLTTPSISNTNIGTITQSGLGTNELKNTHFTENVDISGNLTVSGALIYDILDVDAENLIVQNSSILKGTLDVSGNTDLNGVLDVNNVLETNTNSFSNGYFYNFSQPSNINIGLGNDTTICSFYGSQNTITTSSFSIISPISISESGNNGLISSVVSNSNVVCGNTQATAGTILSFYASGNSMDISVNCNIPISLSESGTKGNQYWISNHYLDGTTIYVFKNGTLFNTITGVVDSRQSYGFNFSWEIGTPIATVYNYANYVINLVNSFVVNHTRVDGLYEFKLATNYRRTTQNGTPSTYSFRYIANSTSSGESGSTNATNIFTVSPYWSAYSYSQTFNYLSSSKINSGTVSLYKDNVFVSSQNIATNTNTFSYSVSSSLLTSFNYNQYATLFLNNFTINHTSSKIPTFYEIRLFLNITRTQSPVINSNFGYILNTSTSTFTKSSNVSLLTTTPTNYLSPSNSNPLSSYTIDYYAGSGSILCNEIVCNKIYATNIVNSVGYITFSNIDLTTYIKKYYIIDFSSISYVNLPLLNDISIGREFIFIRKNPNSTIEFIYQKSNTNLIFILKSSVISGNQYRTTDCYVSFLFVGNNTYHILKA